MKKMKLIDADKAREVGKHIPWCEYDLIEKAIDEIPTEDAELVVHAHYENNRCTNCGAEVPTDCELNYIYEEDISFCWNCGAKMDEEVEE